MTDAGAGYSRGQVDRAGAILKDESVSVADRTTARQVVGWWRGRHRMPLVAVRTLLYQRMRRIASNGFVAQRLKRLPSVEAKLRRLPDMKLSQMQDLGGCRAVVPSVREVDELHRLCRHGRQAHELPKPPMDYLEKPKDDGYRSVHLVYRYRSGSPARRAWNGLRIEVQIRSQLQHSWATAVETVDVLRGTRLKIGGIGNGDWKRFFALMGTVHAVEEGRPVVEGTPEALAEVRDEVRALANRLEASSALVGLAISIDQASKGSGWTLIRLAAAERRIYFQDYAQKQLDRAQKDYLRLEEQYDGDPSVQVCLVDAGSAETLQRAYPNYFLDVGLFVDSLRLFLGESKNR